MRGFARSWLASPSPGAGALVYESDAAVFATWIRVPDRAALLTTPELTTIVVLRTRYYDFDSEPAWLAVRA